MSYIEVEGLKEFQRAVRAAKDKELNKRIGQANKKIGQLVIDRLRPAPVPAATGTGKGAAVRPSASKREVLLRVGGAHRAAGSHTNMQPWGARRVVPPGRPTPKRPWIQGTADANFDDIGEAWMDAIIEAFDPAFAESSK